jgi:hypothetical protein
MIKFIINATNYKNKNKSKVKVKVKILIFTLMANKNSIFI